MPSVRGENTRGPSPLCGQAEVTLNALLALFERGEDYHKENGSLPSGVQNVDRNAQRIAEVQAILENYKIARSGLTEDDIVLPSMYSERNGNEHLAFTEQREDIETHLFNRALQTSDVHLNTTYGGDHLDTFDDFVKDMLVAGNRQRKPKPKYSRVQVLLLSWADDPSEQDEKVTYTNRLIEAEVRAAKDLFEQTLNFSVKRWRIPMTGPGGKSVNSQSKLQLEISSFVDRYDDDETLIILYYNGHGSHYNNSCYWHPTEAASTIHSGFNPTHEFRGPSLEWNPIQNSISPEADLLIILDCCYAGSALIHTKGPQSTTQIMTACGKGYKTPAGPTSFTMRFIEATNDLLATRRKFAVADIYAYLVTSPLKPEPVLLSLRGPGTITIERQRSLELPALSLVVPTTGVDTMAGNSPSSSTSALDHNSIFSHGLNAPGGTITETSSVSSNSSAKVTIVVRMKEDVTPKFSDDWDAFLSALPADDVEGLESVKVEAAFQTNSTLLIVSMPIPLWLLLPQSPAYTFLEFVKGSNMIVPRALTHVPKSIEPLTRSDSLDFENDTEAAIFRLLVTAIRDVSKTGEALPKRPGKISQMITKIGLHPKSHLDPRVELVRYLAQKLEFARDDKGNYIGLTYDFHFTERKVVERTKKCVEQSIDAVEPKLKASIMTGLDHLDQRVFTTAGPDSLLKPHTEHIRPASPSSTPKAQPRSQSTSTRLASSPIPIPEEGKDLAPTASIPRADSGKKSLGTESTKSKRGPLRMASVTSAMRPKNWRKGSTVSIKEVEKLRPESSPLGFP